MCNAVDLIPKVTGDFIPCMYVHILRKGTDYITVTFGM